MITPSNEPRVLLYVPHLLPLHQPWVRQHAKLLPRYKVALAGRRRSHPSLDLNGVCHFRLDDRLFGKVESNILVVTGLSPRLETFVKNFSPDLIHAHFGPGATEIMHIANRLDVPLVVTYHGWDAHLPASGRPTTAYEQLHLLRRQAMFDRSALILAVSDWLRLKLIEIGSKADKTEVHYLGIDLGLFDGRRVVGSGRRIVIVGRLVRSKGIHIALQAMQRLRESLSEVRLTIVGAGPEREALERTALEHRLPVDFVGPQDHSSLRNILASSDVHCFPSTITESMAAEAFGLAAVEAQAMGVPVVATAVGGVPEAILDGRTGLIVPDADPDALAQALLKILTNKDLRQSMSDAARHFVKEKFDARRNMSNLAARYDLLLQQKRS